MFENTQSNTSSILTNKEKKVSIYNSGNNFPTIPDTVTLETPVEDLNLNWTEKDLPERIRTKHVHRLHPYLGKFIPQLVEIFLRKYFKPGDTVLDPFSGSGTTLVQANELNINSVGFDISEFNVLLGKVKTNHYDLSLLKKETLSLLEIVRDTIQSGNSQTLFDAEIKDSTFTTENLYLNKWFAPNALKELLIYRHYLDQYKHKDVFKIILSRSARSARLTTHFDLDFPKKPQTEPYECYKHRRICQPTNEAYKFLYRYSLDTLKRIEEFSKLQTNSKVEVIHGDSRILKHSKVNGIITSPPYVGLIDYHDQHTYAYNLLGLTDNSNEEIGAAKRGTAKAAKEAYKQGMIDVLVNTSKMVKSGGKIIIIAGDRHNLYSEIGEKAKLKLDTIIERHVNRRTGRRSTEFFESIFVYTK